MKSFIQHANDLRTIRRLSIACTSAFRNVVLTRINLLFVCSRNQWRSPTAERVFRDDCRFNVRSCGLSAQSQRQIRESDLIWAEVVFVMEAKHRTRIQQQFRDALGETPLHVLDISDDYEFMDPELIDLIRERVEWHFQNE